MIKLGLLGASGRMGQTVTRLIASEYAAKAQLVAQVDRGSSMEPLLTADAVIDFSAPAAAIEFARAAFNAPKAPALVVGSTGWKLDERRALEELAKRTPVLMASNFSIGVLAVLDILKQASPILEKLGYTPVVVEAHHKHKKDAPSGTALSIQRAIAPAGPGNVQTHSVRAGEVIGDHEVTFHGVADRIVLGHFAQDRSIFARGAIDVALWLAAKRDQNPGTLIGIDKYFDEIKTVR